MDNLYLKLYHLFLSSGYTLQEFCERDYKNHSFPSAEIMENVIRRLEGDLMKAHGYSGKKANYEVLFFRQSILDGEKKLNLKDSEFCDNV